MVVLARVFCDCCGCETDVLFVVFGEGLFWEDCFLLFDGVDVGMSRFARFRED